SVGAWSQSSEEKTCTRKQQEEASNPSRGTPNDSRERGKKDSLRNPERKGLHGTEMSQNLTKPGGKVLVT
ncbi:hypothetical protein ABG768_016020, partial [Culter alburnus]